MGLLVLLQLLPQLLLRPRLLSLSPRERLNQLLRLMPKLTLRLTHGCCTADTTDTHMDIMLHLPTPMLPMSTLMPTPTMVSHMLTMVRDLLMLNQRLMLVLTLMPMLGMDTTDGLRPYGYRAYGYGYPYRYGYYGKRDADAEPEAKADADAYYGYYG